MKLNSIHDVSGALATGSSVTGLTLWGLDISDIGVGVSAVFGVLTFCVYLWSSIRRDRRAQELHRARLKQNDLDGQPG